MSERDRKRIAQRYCRDTMLTVRRASDWLKIDKELVTRSKEYFGELWRSGEVAVLFGESGSGKSLLATQIAESIARGRTMIHPTGEGPRLLMRPPRPQSVLYFDFERSDEQFTERYSCASPVAGKLPVKYRFSPKLARTGYKAIRVPDAFDGDFGKFFKHSMEFVFGEAEPRVVIIDNLASMTPDKTGKASSIKAMRSLKILAATTGVSILVIAHAKPRPERSLSMHASRTTRPLSLNDLAPGPDVAAIADSVFAIGRSSFADDIRYVKHLKSNSAPVQHGSDNVLTYQIERTTGPANSAVAPCFLGLTYLGPSTELDHLRDYQHEARLAEAARQSEQKRLLKRSARTAIFDGIIDGSYAKYLKGE